MQGAGNAQVGFTNQNQDDRTNSSSSPHLPCQNYYQTSGAPPLSYWQVRNRVEHIPHSLTSSRRRCVLCRTRRACCRRLRSSECRHCKVFNTASCGGLLTSAVALDLLRTRYRCVLQLSCVVFLLLSTKAPSRYVPRITSLHFRI